MQPLEATQRTRRDAVRYAERATSRQDAALQRASWCEQVEAVRASPVASQPCRSRHCSRRSLRSYSPNEFEWGQSGPVDGPRKILCAAPLGRWTNSAAPGSGSKSTPLAQPVAWDDANALDHGHWDNRAELLRDSCARSWESPSSGTHPAIHP